MHVDGSMNRNTLQKRKINERGGGVEVKIKKI